MHGGLAGALLAAHLSGAVPASPSEPAAACLREAAVAEQRWRLPARILLAIGEVESGRADPATRRRLPWPWTANVAGTDHVFASAVQATATVAALREAGIASIDVGCFQVNLRYHPSAFATVAQGFDPAANADYAGRFLRSLFERSGSWESAIAAYHSAEPGEGFPYRARVLRAWHDWADATGWQSSPAKPEGDRHVILAAAAAAAIPVYTPATLPPGWREALLPAASKPIGKGKPSLN